MLSSSLDTLLKVSKTKSPQKLFAYDCVTLYVYFIIYKCNKNEDPSDFLWIQILKSLHIRYTDPDSDHWGKKNNWLRNTIPGPGI